MTKIKIIVSLVVLVLFILQLVFFNYKLQKLTNDNILLKQQIIVYKAKIENFKQQLKNKSFEEEQLNKKLKLQKELDKKDRDEIKIPDKEGNYTITF